MEGGRANGSWHGSPFPTTAVVRVLQLFWRGAVGGSSWSVIAAIIKENTVVDGSRNCMDRSIVRWSLSLAGCGN